MDIPPIDAQVRRDVGSPAGDDATSAASSGRSREGDPPGAEQTIGLAVFDAGGSNVEHTHPNCEEIVYVLEGEVEHTLGDQSTMLRAGDLIVVPRDVPHRLINHGAAPVPDVHRVLVAGPAVRADGTLILRSGATIRSCRTVGCPSNFVLRWPSCASSRPSLTTRHWRTRPQLPRPSPMSRG